MIHPTQKPVALCEYLIKTYSNEGDSVLDNTMGSGTTGVACINTNRRFIGIEKEKEYFEIAKKRIEEAEKALDKKIIKLKNLSILPQNFRDLAQPTSKKTPKFCGKTITRKSKSSK
ncbi:MAG: site-specific DNA-methyltransferase [Anaerolineales bacterium]|nr:site-specific DNA-methyltransferase [Anaerolineales bacterium]